MMKKLFLGILIFSSIEIYAQTDVKKEPFETELEVIEKVLAIDRETLVAESQAIVDSFYRKHTAFNLEISDEDYEQLKEGCKKRTLSIDFLQEILPGYEPDKDVYLDVVKRTYPIDYYIFSEDKNDFDYYVIIPEKGSAPFFCAYFFKEKTLIERHDVYQSEYLKVDYFKTDSGDCIIYYPQLFVKVTGSFWENYFFYRYTHDNKLMPVLNELRTAATTMPWNPKTYQYNTEILNTNPLEISMNYEVYTFDTETKAHTLWMRQATTTSYDWNDSLRQYVPQFTDSMFNRSIITSFYLLNNERLFIHCFADELRKMLFGDNILLSKLTSTYLNKVRSNIERGNRKP